jgi:hypothetical protein
MGVLSSGVGGYCDGGKRSNKYVSPVNRYVRKDVQATVGVNEDRKRQRLLDRSLGCRWRLLRQEKKNRLRPQISRANESDLIARVVIIQLVA